MNVLSEETLYKSALGDDWVALDPEKRYFAVLAEENHHEILRELAHL